MSSVSASKGAAGNEYSIDLLVFGAQSLECLSWRHGYCVELKNADENRCIQEINSWAETSRSDYLLLWSGTQAWPEPDILFSIIASGVDLAHCGLKQGLAKSLQDLCMLGFSWDKLNASPKIASTNWRLGMDACLVRRDVLLTVGGLDSVFSSWTGAGLELGFRCLRLGAVVEYRPELAESTLPTIPADVSLHDLYCFLLRHFRLEWTRYVFFRRLLRKVNWIEEWKGWQSARLACAAAPPNWTLENSSVDRLPEGIPSPESLQVSVVIPTLGRYTYIPQALNSLLNQTILPAEVIVIDQNPPKERQPDVYRGYEKLNLRVIWQDERGQSLARNTGIRAANAEYVLLFDDDSIAYLDLIERHCQAVFSGRYDVSTGVSIPPSSPGYSLPAAFRFPRLSQTFDTGNSLMRLDVIRRIGGLDRNFDFGPGADADLGTRLYLAGYRILHNPAAIRVHFKAPGGLRVHGAYKYNSDVGVLQPFPPVTQSYYALRYLSDRQATEVAWLGFFLSKFPKELRTPGKPLFKKVAALVRFCFLVFLLPLKRWRSTQKARQMLNGGSKLERFDKPASAKQSI